MQCWSSAAGQRLHSAADQSRRRYCGGCGQLPQVSHAPRHAAGGCTEPSSSRPIALLAGTAPRPGGACWRYTPANTYAAPVAVFLPFAPATAVDPEMATEAPKWSPVAASAAVSSACCGQVLPEPVYTYAVPM